MSALRATWSRWLGACAVTVWFLGACERPPEEPVPGGEGAEPPAAGETGGEALDLGAGIKDPPATGGGTIAGVVRFDGTPPSPVPLDMSQKPECQGAHSGNPPPSETILVNPDKTLRDVVVFVNTKGRYRPRPEPVVFDQLGCVYKPHVFGIMKGQELKILNSDPWLHNVNCPLGRFNHSMEKKGDVRVEKLKVTGAVNFQCSVHPWMKAYAYVLEHPFFSVSGEDGKFEIEHVPAGKHTLTVWHEKVAGLVAPQGVEVEVKEGETATVELTFSYKK